MKKTVSLIAVVMIVLGAIFVSAPKQVIAKSDPFSSSEDVLIAGGSWTGGTSVDVTDQAASAPKWIQLLTKGVKVTEAGEICHPFRGGRFGWVGQIMQYKDGQWVKLATTNDWVPSSEGVFMSCAQASTPGTYALFGYYVKPKVAAVQDEAFDCNSLDWSDFGGLVEGTIYLWGTVSPVPEGTTITFRLTHSDDDDLVIGTTGTIGTTYSDGHFEGNTGLSGSAATLVRVIFTESEHHCTSPDTDISVRGGG